MMSRSKNLFLFFLFVFHFTLSSAQNQPIPLKFNYLTVDEGLSHTDANDIAQDNKGFIWIATYFGISRYDGYAIKKFYNTNEPVHNAFKNRVRSICSDENGRLWLGTEDGLQCFDPKAERYLDFKHLAKYVAPPITKLVKPQGDKLYALTGNILRVYKISGDSILEDRLSMPRGTFFSDFFFYKSVLYLTGNNGLWALDQDNIFKKIAVAGIPTALSHIFIDSQGNFLLSDNNNVFLALKEQNLKLHKSFAGNGSIRDIRQGGQMDYWVNTGAALLRLDKDLNFIQKVDNESSLNGLNSRSLEKIFIDRSQCLWVCSFGGGINYCDLNQKLFYTIRRTRGEANSLSGNHIRSILEDGNKLYIGTTANGLNLYNFATKRYTYYNTANSAVKLKSDMVICLTFDREHNLWVGGGAGIDILKPGGRALWKPKGYEKFPKYVIETLSMDCYGNIWFGNHANSFGVIWKDDKGVYQVKYYDEGYFILTDESKPQMFISSTNGLKRVLFDERGNIIHTFRYRASSGTNSLTSDYIYPVCKQADGIYWIGTIGGGLNRLTVNLKTNAYTIKRYGTKNGIFNDIESMEIDHAGNIWMGENGLLRFDPKTEKLIRYDKNDGMQGNSFKNNASFKGADGRLYFGGINGLNYFYPNQIRLSKIEAMPVLTDILINNQKPGLIASDSLKNSIKEAISYAHDLELSHLQNNFIISFSSMDYANPLKCKYRYKLIGFDKEWRYTDGHNPTAAYSNLNYSNYKFALEATNIDGIWGKSKAELNITVIPPWWKSDLAKALYSILAISGLAGIYVYQSRWHLLKREIELRAVNEQKREEMHQQRTELYQQQLQFFTNISHEFRTPLTLILGPLEQLVSKNKYTELSNSYQLMLRNTKRLMNLLSELMNFKKTLDNIIKLNVQPLAIRDFYTGLASEFQELANGKDINFKLIDHTGTKQAERLVGLFDKPILEKILFNLLNNAFKYTEAGGEVSFEVFFDLEQYKPSFKNEFQLLNKDYRAKKYIYFAVGDTGIGISGDAIHKIFDRYYRISRDQLGSGIGLALVKSLTQLHKGDIYLYSERYKGTEIIVGIPWGEENYAEAGVTSLEGDLAPQLEPVDNSILIPLLLETNHDREDLRNKKRILIVDDNEELRFFLRQTFEKHFYIYEAANGLEGLEIAIEQVPDLIVSDVMMPVMDGITFCKSVKEQFEISHIPFIILSAKDTLGSKVEGMESGADYYFGKPLNMELLFLTVQNIIEQGEKLKQRYSRGYLVEAKELVRTEKDKEFLQKILDVIEENIQDPNLDVDYLCRYLCISRTKLYQKIKGVSDLSVGEFIRTIRLKKAINIMTHEDVSMTEVVDRIGLQSSSNFARAFKNHYGQSPMQFIKSLKK
ncbi:two-component regulator propeller domain-containing protein [Pedobacter miscanthi]|uniref:hybrid sensor histidine kinase/response regulator transcription factor n=1 Tax=Pedobacter miscanthi TaxID=2259170 RepID=UPI00292DF26D|nr:two-component regulator propeller domain-containing protein [Pedobacter miscanthi]